MTRHSLRNAHVLAAGLLSALGLIAANGCDPDLGVPDANRAPTADARVMGMEGQNAVVDYNGSPVAVTLDGSFSKDLDGTIKTYRWLSGLRIGGTMAAAGSGAAGSMGTAGRAAGAAGAVALDEDGGVDSGGGNRVVPAGQPDDWPDDVVQPQVTLTEGDYVFVLWVIDNKNVVSAPSTLKVTVRKPLSPAVQMCTEKVYDGVSTACKACVCGASDACQGTITTESVCDATCWGFLSCIATKCPTYMPGGDTGCLVNMCSSLLGGATGAQMIAPCIAPCRDACRSTM